MKFLVWSSLIAVCITSAHKIQSLDSDADMIDAALTATGDDETTTEATQIDEADGEQKPAAAQAEALTTLAAVTRKCYFDLEIDGKK
jgi:hypothetical protein